MSILQPVQSTFRAVAETVVPEAAGLRPEQWREMEREVEAALAARPEGVRRQVVLLLRVINGLAIAKHLRSFRRLPPARREALLRALQDGSSLQLRRGIWGVRTLVFMAYYTRPEVQGALGYAPSAAGWSARRTTGEMRAAVAAERVEIDRASGALRTGLPWDPPDDGAPA